MYKMLQLIIVVLLVSGCATTKGVSGVDNLKIKVAQMETQLNKSQEDIAELRAELDDMSYQENSRSTKRVDTETMDIDEASNVSISQPPQDGEQIIRVNIGPDQVQKALKNAGYYSGTVDGKIGRLSKKAIADFQLDHNLKNDGIVGQKTWVELKKYLE